MPGASELELPSSLESWVAALGLWASVDEPTYRLVARCFGNGRGPEWPFLCSLLLHAGLVEPVSPSETFTFRHEWVPALERALVALGGADAARSRLVDAWLDTPDRRLVAEVVGWASDAARWDAVDEIWMALAEDTGDLPPEALAIYRDLPPEARTTRPMLSWASGAAESLLADPEVHRPHTALHRVLLDSEVLHSDWSMREDPDAAVTAGTIRLIGERRLPTTHAGQSLEAAWRTKQDIDEFIDARSREGGGPSQTPQAIFRAFSARLALFRGDLQRAVSEARWAVLLSDWEPVSVLAEGIEALAESIASDDGPVRDFTPDIEKVNPAFVVRGLKGVGQVFEVLAEGNDALRRLDCDGVDRALIAVTPEVAAVAGVWSVRVSLAGFRAALWGEVDAGLKQLSAEIAHESISDREQEEPLGRAMLARARVLLLIKAGAFRAATRTAEAMGGSLKMLPLARVHLWAGQYEEAIGLAAGGPFESGLDLGDQYRLKLLRAAAALLDESCDDELKAAGVAELLRMLDNEAFLPIALLPQPARTALLDLCRSDGLADHAAFTVLADRLRLLNDAGEEGVQPAQLTAREILLLPMLAGKDSVPQIASELQVSVNTVRKQVATLRAKFHADTRADLIRKAIAYGALR
ncbi:MAG TPA: helix-turn-helix transcriptional regulator [Propionicimonas sp.]|uniref:helix-turn-helix transcriptional regulator n=1 Tax=Propionicimonas sp. TaxID=1955623 RepID=UPI002F404E18